MTGAGVLRDGLEPFEGPLVDATVADVICGGLVRQVLPKGPRDRAHQHRAAEAGADAVARRGSAQPRWCRGDDRFALSGLQVRQKRSFVTTSRPWS